MVKHLCFCNFNNLYKFKNVTIIKGTDLHLVIDIRHIETVHKHTYYFDRFEGKIS